MNTPHQGDVPRPHTYGHISHPSLTPSLITRMPRIAARKQMLPFISRCARLRRIRQVYPHLVVVLYLLVQGSHVRQDCCQSLVQRQYKQVEELQQKSMQAGMGLKSVYAPLCVHTVPSHTGRHCAPRARHGLDMPPSSRLPSFPHISAMVESCRLACSARCMVNQHTRMTGSHHFPSCTQHTHPGLALCDPGLRSVHQW